MYSPHVMCSSMGLASHFFSLSSTSSVDFPDLTGDGPYVELQFIISLFYGFQVSLYFILPEETVNRKHQGMNNKLLTQNYQKKKKRDMTKCKFNRKVNRKMVRNIHRTHRKKLDMLLDLQKKRNWDSQKKCVRTF